MEDEPGPLGPRLGHTAWDVSGSLTRQLFSNHLKKAREKNSQPLVLRAVSPLGETGLGEGFWLKKGRERFSSWAVPHLGAPVPGAFNMFVVKLSAGESQHSSQ